jgi:hypothetical protein
MIPQSAIHFNPDGTAWSVGDDLDKLIFDLFDLAVQLIPRKRNELAVLAGAAWTVEVECTGTLQPNDQGGLTCDGGCADAYPWGTVSYRVSVVPGMVLPIVAWGQRREIEPPYLVTQLPPPMAIYVDADRIARATVTLPPDAKPGMWAVKLQVHQ